MSTEKLFCRFCGKEVPEDSVFCSYCGRSLEYIADGPKTDPSIDKAEIPDPTNKEIIDNAYCHVKQKNKPSNYKSRYIIACGIVFLAFMFAMLYNYQKGHPEWLNTFSNIASNEENITLKEYNQIEMGMTYDEVVGIIGSYGKESARTEMNGYTTVIFMWDGVGIIGANASVTFQNGQAVSKAQAGLE